MKLLTPALAVMLAAIAADAFHKPAEQTDPLDRRLSPGGRARRAVAPC